MPEYSVSEQRKRRREVTQKAITDTLKKRGPTKAPKLLRLVREIINALKDVEFSDYAYREVCKQMMDMDRIRFNNAINTYTLVGYEVPSHAEEEAVVEEEAPPEETTDELADDVEEVNEEDPANYEPWTAEQESAEYRRALFAAIVTMEQPVHRTALKTEAARICKTEFFLVRSKEKLHYNLGVTIDNMVACGDIWSAGKDLYTHENPHPQKLAPMPDVAQTPEPSNIDQYAYQDSIDLNEQMAAAMDEARAKATPTEKKTEPANPVDEAETVQNYTVMRIEICVELSKQNVADLIAEGAWAQTMAAVTRLMQLEAMQDGHLLKG